MASGDTKTEALLNILGNGGDASEYRGCCNTKTQEYILDAIDRIESIPGASDFTGATDSTDGTHGLVPAPQAGDQTKFLKGDGTWATVSGGGGSYVAGNGIDITNDTISVDTTVIQPKLTAGANITIENNVISSSAEGVSEINSQDWSALWQ